jgi:hypothetical protein
LGKTDERQNEAAQMRVLRPLVKLTRVDHIRNEEICQQLGEDNIITKL